MKKTLKEIARIVGGEVVGDPNVILTGVCGIREAKKGDITFVANRRYVSLIDETEASAILVPLDIEIASKPLIRTKDPSLAFSKIMAEWYPIVIKHPRGIHKTAVVAKSAKIARGVAIGPYAIIEDDVEIGANSIIYGGCFVGHDTKIGCNCLFWPNVSIRERVTIGNKVSVQSGTVIGAEGFGYTNADGVYQLLPQIGTVVIEDEVEIGANVTIDRARFDKTFIGKGTKIDNLVQIAHNVVIGKNSIIIAQAGISGSTHIGDNVTIAGQAGLVGHITIGDGAICAAQAGVTKSVLPKTIVSGYPARPHEEAKRINAYIQRLPDLAETVKNLKKKIEELEEKIKNGARQG
jgi:UDP-3-O-[3-hydroxymyristoyl] glucosamine N-acyltransferase